MSCSNRESMKQPMVPEGGRNQSIDAPIHERRKGLALRFYVKLRFLISMRPKGAGNLTVITVADPLCN